MINTLTADLLNVLVALRKTLSKSFVLTNQCATVLKFLPSIEKDIKFEGMWYQENPSVSYDLLKNLHKFLNFANKRMVVTGTSRSAIILLKKAAILLNIKILQGEFNDCWGKLLSIVFFTELSNRLGKDIKSCMNPEKVSDNLTNDFELYTKNCQDTLSIIREDFQNHRLGKLVGSCLDYLTPEMMTSSPNFEIFQNESFQEASEVVANYVICLDPQEARLLSKVNLDDFKPRKPRIQGRLGKIFYTKLDLRKGGKTETLSLQIMPPHRFHDSRGLDKLDVAAELTLLLNFKHPSVLNVIGFTMTWCHLYVALEPISRTLNKVLHGNSRCSYTILSESQVLSVISSLADATTFLHSKGLIHGDIRPENVYVPTAADEDITSTPVKLANLCYGLNHNECNWETLVTREGLEYQAPEVLEGMASSYASDVYSLAIVLWELCQKDEKPFHHVSDSQFRVIEAIQSGERPLLREMEDEREPGWAIDLMKSSWTPEAFVRPTASAWQNMIERLIDEK